MTTTSATPQTSSPATPGSGAEALATFAPEVAENVRRLVAMAPLGPSGEPLTGAARHTVTQITGLRPLPGAVESIEQAPPVEAAIEMAEQMALDVSGVSDEQRTALGEGLGRGASTFLLTVYLADWIPRMRHALDALFGASDWDDLEPSDQADRLWAEFGALSESIGRLRELDPVISEYVRLRMARQHNCALCKSLRTRTALEAGGSEGDYAHLDDWRNSDVFDERQRAALALADVMVWQPRDLDAALVDELRARFSPAEQVELIVDMLRNSANKVAIAGGTDGAHVSEGVEIYDITASGETVFGLGFEPAP